MKLPLSYYQNADVVFLAKDLLGKSLFTNIGSQGITGGIITETEAYEGPIDKASHAYGNRRTKRTATMYKPGGLAYIYLCYGIHHLFNVVTNVEEIPHAILIRAIKPTHGIEIMLNRMAPKNGKMPGLNGPGKLSKALGINTLHDSTPLTGDIIWIENSHLIIPDNQITATPRIGVDYAGEHANWPYRFIWDASAGSS